jgi:AmmeMemoRadiSam system protein A
MTESLTPDEQCNLLRIAREAVTAAVLNRDLDRPDLMLLPPAFAQPGACFVTLTRDGELRGCIGGLEAVQPLAFDVQDHAAQAALYDFRFPPVTEAELPELEIEISVLTEPRPLKYRDAAELMELLRPGIDGVILIRGLQRATFLPQVWERVPLPADFLSLLCQKMNVPEDEWRRGTLDVRTYQAYKFAEAEASGG